MRFSRLPAGVLAFLLWITTVTIGLWEIVIIRGVLLRIYARFSSNYWPAVNLGNWTTFILAAVWLAFAVGSGEYHYRRAGQRSSWQLFAWSIAVELVILVLAYFV